VTFIQTKEKANSSITRTPTYSSSVSSSTDNSSPHLYEKPIRRGASNSAFEAQGETVTSSNFNGNNLAGSFETPVFIHKKEKETQTPNDLIPSGEEFSLEAQAHKDINILMSQFENSKDKTDKIHISKYIK
jgi:hypothetical protein